MIGFFYDIIFNFANLNKSFLTPAFSKLISALISLPLPSSFNTSPLPNLIWLTIFPTIRLLSNKFVLELPF